MSVSSVVKSLPSSFKSSESQLPLLLAFVREAIASGDEGRIRHACSRVQNYLADKNVLDSSSRGQLIVQFLDVLLGASALSAQLTNALLNILSSLLKRDKLETKVVISWSKCLALFERIAFHSLFPSRLLSDADDRLIKSVQTFLRSARRYFDKEVVPNILERCMAGLVYPNHNEAERCLSVISVFVPDDLFSLWINPIVQVWPLIRDHSSWDNKILTLLSRAAKSSLKTDYCFPSNVIDQIFTRVLTRLDVTLGGSSKLVEGLMARPESSFYGGIGEKAGNASAFSRWVSCSLTPRDDDPVFVALDRFLATLETYFHPSNRGKWTGSLAAILSGLSRGLASRLARQRDARKQVHASKQLRQSDFDRVVRVLLKVAHFAMFSKDDDLSLSARSALKFLGYISPSIVFDDAFMEKIYFALQTLTATQQTVSALSTLGVISHPLFSSSLNPGGAKHLIPILMLAVQGIDSNDSLKTNETFKFFVSVLQWIPLVDESDNDYQPANEDEAAAKQATSSFGDWAVLVWEKITVLLSNLQKQEQVSFRALWDYQTVLSPFLRLFFAQMAPSFRMRFLRDHVTSYLVSERHNGAMAEVQLILMWAVSSDPVVILREVAPRIVQLVWKNGEFVDAGVPMISWALDLLVGCSKRAGSEALLPFVQQFSEIGLACLDYEHDAIDSLEVRRRGGQLLGALLSSLFGVCVKDQFFDPTQKNHFLRWGHVSKLADMGNGHWIAPSEASIAAGAALINRLLAEADVLLLSKLEEAEMTKVHLLLQSILRAGNALPFCDDEEDLYAKSVAADRAKGLPPYFRLEHFFGCEIQSLSFVRKAIRGIIFRLHEQSLAKRAHSSEPFSLLATLIDVYQMGDSNDTASMIMGQARKQWGLKLRCPLVKGGNSRFMNTWKSEAFFRQLLPLRGQDAPDTEPNRRLASILTELAVSEYAEVRKSAQDALFVSCMTFYGSTREVIIPRMVDLFLAAKTEQQIKGCLHFFDENLTLEKVRRFRQRDFLRALLQCSSFDNAKIQVRVLEVFQSFLGVCLSPAHVMELPSNVPDYVASKNRRMLERNRGILDDLLALGATRPHWRYEVMVCAMLTVLSRVDEPDMRVIRFLMERLVSDVPQIRGIASTAVTLFLKRFSHKVTELRHEWKTTANADEFFDKPWEGFSEHRFLHKIKKEELLNHESVQTVLEFLSKPGIADRIATLNALDSSSSAPLESRSANHSGISQMLRAYGIDSSVVSAHMGNDSSSEKKIVLDNIEQLWPLTCVSVSLGMFHVVRAIMWKSIVKSNNRIIPEFLYTAISTFIQPTKTREENAVAMEMIAGALRATKDAPQRLLDMLKPALLGCSNDSHYDFLAMLRFSVYNRDPRRFKPLIGMIFSMVQESQTASSTLAKSLRYVEALIVEFDWKIASECHSMFAVLRGLLDYPYGQARLAAASVLFRMISLAKDAPQDFASLFEFLEDEDVLAVSRKRETLLMFASMSIRSQKAISFYGRLIEFVFAAHLDAEQDVSKLAKGLTSTLALCVFPANVLEGEIQSTLVKLASTATWKQRAAIPLVLTLLDFNHRFVSSRSGSFEPLVLSLLQDAHVEVRQVSELALRSMLTGTLNEQRAKELDTKLQVMQPHSAALGYSAMVLSCPYTVPSYVVPAIYKLIGMSGPMCGPVVQTTIAEFRRTHEELEEVLDPDLMRALKSAIVKPSYFA